jgi:hypothetical protein
VISGRAYIDLRSVEPVKMKSRLGGISAMPANAEVVINVGALAVEPEAIWFLRSEERRLSIVIEGAPFNVPRWLDAMRNGFGELVG